VVKKGLGEAKEHWGVGGRREVFKVAFFKGLHANILKGSQLFSCAAPLRAEKTTLKVPSRNESITTAGAITGKMSKKKTPSWAGRLGAKKEGQRKSRPQGVRDVSST